MGQDEKLCYRLGDASLDAVALAIEDFADGGEDFSEAEAWEAILRMERLCGEARRVVDGIQRGIISREEARKFIVEEDLEGG